MAKYVVKRIMLAIVTVFIICAITFFAMNAIPGGPFSSEKALSPEVEAVLMERYNLDKPVSTQFVLYLKNLLKGDFGVSLKTGRDIAKTVMDAFKVSAKIGGTAALLALICGLVLGSIAALMRNQWPDRLIVFLSTLATASEQNYVLPVISLAMYPMAYITRLTKTSMLDALGQDYIRTARAKGVSQIKVIFKHALRNALIPVITYVGPMLAYILTGSLVVENIFTIGGLGSKFVTGITTRDYPMIMATTIFLATLMVVMNLISDLVYKLVDPRITFE